MAAALALGGCGARGPLLHELGPEALFERGMSELAEEDWDDAVRAFEQFLSSYPADSRAEEARFRVGEAYFGKEEYVQAATEFVRFATDYPSSGYADDARFQTCQAYHNLSPKPQLDQQYTRAAIEHCEALIAYYPASEFTPRAQALITDLYDKLAQKSYLSGDYYYKRRAYDSSIVYFEHVIENFPQSTYAPKALLRLVQVYGHLGYQEELEATRTRLEREYPDSEEARQAKEVSLAGRR